MWIVLCIVCCFLLKCVLLFFMCSNMKMWEWFMLFVLFVWNVFVIKVLSFGCVLVVYLFKYLLKRVLVICIFGLKLMWFDIWIWMWNNLLIVWSVLLFLVFLSLVLNFCFKMVLWLLILLKVCCLKCFIWFERLRLKL